MNVVAGQSVTVAGKQYTVEINATTGERFVSLDDGRKLVFGVFDAEAKNCPGKAYWYTQFTEVDKLIELIGGELVLDLVNAISAQRQRQRAVNGYLANRPEDKQLAEIYDRQKELLVDLDDAAAWRPGSRELSVSGLSKQLSKALADLNKATASGATEDIGRLMGEVSAIMLKLSKTVEEQRKMAEQSIA